MADSPTTTNPTATEVNTVINDAIQTAETAASTAIETALDSAAPVFAAPVIHQVSDLIIEDVVGEVGKELSVGLQQVGTFIVIDTQVSSEKNGVSQALANLMIAEKSGDQNAIQAAIVAYQKANSALDNDDGSAPPVT